MSDELEHIAKVAAAEGALIEALGAIGHNSAVEGAIEALRTARRQLELRRPSPAQRRFTTVLFADLAGFTSLAERMDAEDVGTLLNTIWERLDAVIQEHGGAVDKHMGDGLMALWGADGAHEGDAEQAVRAALGMQAALARIDHTRAAVPGAPTLRMRIGINTGPVLVGRLGSLGDLTALGDAVNLASRLEEAAAPGSVLISHDTYRHVRGVFDVEIRAPMAVKGKADMVKAYVVHREKPRAFRASSRGVEGTDTRTIGRETELQATQEAWRAAISGPETTVLTVVGDAGVGKSRLLADFGDWLEVSPERVYYMEARATPGMPGAPHALIRALLSFRFQIRDSDPVRELVAKLEAGARELLGESGEEKAHILGAWLGFEMPDSPYLRGADPQQLHDRGLVYLGELLAAAAAARRPAVVLLDDLQWADIPSLDVLERVLSLHPGLPLLVVGAARPPFHEERPSWSSCARRHVRIALGPLDPKQSRLLVAEVLRRIEVVPPELFELIVARAEGNPFYVEELVKMLIEDGVVLTGPTSWRVDETRLAQLRVPATLTEILRARIDGLGQDERRTLQIASIVGRTFWQGAVDCLAGGSPTGGTVAILEKLESRELIAEQSPSSFEHTRELAFRHALMRDVTYESILKSERKRYHEAVARWLGEVSDKAGRVEEYACLIASHYELADNWTAAAPWYQRAGECAASRFANADAAEHLRHALSLWPEESRAERFDLLSVLEQVHELQADREGQRRTLLAMRDLAERLQDPARQALCAYREAALASSIGDYDAAAAASDIAIGAARVSGSRRLEARALIAKATAQWRRAAFDQVAGPLEEARAIAQEMPDLQAEIFRTMGVVDDSQGRYEAACDNFSKALELFRSLKRLRGIGRTLNSLGVATHHLGHHDEARALLEEALDVRRQLGDRSGMGATLSNLAVVAVSQTDIAGAARLYGESLDVCRAIQDIEGEAAATMGLAFTARTCGDYATAERREDAALELFRRIGDRAGETEALFQKSMTALLLDRPRDAEFLASEALAIAREIGAAHEELTALLCLAEALAVQGGAARALGLASEAREIAARLPKGEWMARTLLVRARARAEVGDRAGASEDANAVLDYLERHPTLGPEDPLRPFAICRKVLEAAGEPRAAEAAAAGRRLRDAVRQRLENDADRARYDTSVYARQLEM